MTDRCEPPEGAADYPKWISGDSLWVSPDRCLFHSYGEAKCGNADSFYACNRPKFRADLRIKDDARAWLTEAARHFPEPITPPAEVAALRAEVERLEADLARAAALIEDLMPALGDEGEPWSAEGLDALRARVSIILAAIKERKA